MKKSYKFNELSDQICQRKSCTRKLKKRRVEEHGDTLCYKCYLISKMNDGHWNYHPGKLKRAGLRVNA